METIYQLLKQNNLDFEEFEAEDKEWVSEINKRSIEYFNELKAQGLSDEAIDYYMSHHFKRNSFLNSIVINILTEKYRPALKSDC